MSRAEQDRNRVRLLIAGIMDQLDERRHAGVLHAHRNGWEACPVCGPSRALRALDDGPGPDRGPAG